MGGSSALKICLLHLTHLYLIGFSLCSGSWRPPKAVLLSESPVGSMGCCPCSLTWRGLSGSPHCRPGGQCPPARPWTWSCTPSVLCLQHCTWTPSTVTSLGGPGCLRSWQRTSACWAVSGPCRKRALLRTPGRTQRLGHLPIWWVRLFPLPAHSHPRYRAASRSSASWTAWPEAPSTCARTWRTPRGRGRRRLWTLRREKPAVTPRETSSSGQTWRTGRALLPSSLICNQCISVSRVLRKRPAHA